MHSFAKVLHIFNRAKEKKQAGRDLWFLESSNQLKEKTVNEASESGFHGLRVYESSGLII